MIRAIKEKINRRRRQILVHSCIYYRYNKSVIPDALFDDWSDELAEIQSQYPNLSNQCIYATAFRNFDGSTGFHLPLGDSWVRSRAIHLMKNPYVKESV